MEQETGRIEACQMHGDSAQELKRGTEILEGALNFIGYLGSLPRERVQFLAKAC